MAKFLSAFEFNRWTFDVERWTFDVRCSTFGVRIRIGMVLGTLFLTLNLSRAAETNAPSSKPEVGGQRSDVGGRVQTPSQLPAPSPALHVGETNTLSFQPSSLSPEKTPPAPSSSPLAQDAHTKAEAVLNSALHTGATSSAPRTQTSSPSALSSLPNTTPTSKPAAAPNEVDDKHRLAIGDKLSFRVLEDEQDPTASREPVALVVADSGELEVPYIGRISAVNRTCKELALEIKSALEKDYYQKATVVLAVDLMAHTRGTVYVVGPVGRPGPEEIPSDEVLTLGKAIMRAGGCGEFADRKNVKIIRKGATATDKPIIVDVAEILDKGKVDKDVPLESGDLIIVPERAIRF